jgi:hypothetical protein
VAPVAPIDASAASEAPPSPVRASDPEPRKAGWLERALRDEPPAPASATQTVAAPEKDSDDKLATSSAPEPAAPEPVREAPVMPASARDAAPEPEAMSKAPEPPAAPPAEPEKEEPSAPVTPTFDDKPPAAQDEPSSAPEPVRASAAAPVEVEEPVEKPVADQKPPPRTGADLPRVVRRYESQGVRYILYDDGSIDADSSAGRFRFASLDELREFLEKKA